MIQMLIQVFNIPAVLFLCLLAALAALFGVNRLEDWCERQLEKYPAL